MPARAFSTDRRQKRCGHTSFRASEIGRLPGFRVPVCLVGFRASEAGVSHTVSTIRRVRCQGFLRSTGCPCGTSRHNPALFVCVYSPLWMGMDGHAAGAKLASTAKTISCGNSMWQTISCVNFMREKRTHNPSMCSEMGSMCSLLGLCVRFST